MEKSYSFPVTLKPIYTEVKKDELTDIKEVIGGQKALIREDTGKVLSIVSDNYKLITHEEVVNCAMGLLESVGEAKFNFSMNASGSTLVATAEYRNIKEGVAVGDDVGLRIHVENSYNKTRGVSFYIGGLVLSCMNGMVSSSPLASFRFRHLKAEELVLPTVDDLMHSWDSQVSNWRMYAESPIPFKDAEMMVLKNLHTILPPKSIHGVVASFREKSSGGDVLLWDVHQAVTYAVTHGNKRISELGRILRLKAFDKIFERNVFPIREV